MIEIEARKQLEAEFHDRLREGLFDQRWSREAEKRLRDDPMWSNFKYYSIERKSVAYMHDWVKAQSAGKVVLDYGCGNGEESVFAARHGAREVVGIDISSVAVENSARRAEEAGVGGVARFLETDGEALDFPDDRFDVAMEYGVLHHVDLDAAMAQLARVLKPSGRMICTETLGHNKIIHLYRKMTPQIRTAWETEHILRRRDFRTIGKYFGKLEMRFFHLATLGAVPLRRSPGFTLLLRTLEGIDELLLRLPILRWQAWQTVFVLSEPKKFLSGS